MVFAESYTSLDEMLAKGDRLLTLRKAAFIADKHPDTLKRKFRRGELKLVKTSSRGYDIWLSDLAQYLKDPQKAAEDAAAQRVAIAGDLKGFVSGSMIEKAAA